MTSGKISAKNAINNTVDLYADAPLVRLRQYRQMTDPHPF